MISRLLKKIVRRLGVWRSVQAALGGSALILFATAISQVFVPFDSGQTDWQAKKGTEFAASANISVLLDEDKGETKKEIAYRPGMFSPASGLGDKPLADKTIERIKEQLNLQCVMEMNGEIVAYININGVGLKKCCVGENINDMFTVLEINKENKSVGISIVEHKVTLHL